MTLVSLINNFNLGFVWRILKRALKADAKRYSIRGMLRSRKSVVDLQARECPWQPCVYPRATPAKARLQSPSQTCESANQQLNVALQWIKEVAIELASSWILVRAIEFSPRSGREAFYKLWFSYFFFFPSHGLLFLSVTCKYYLARFYV